MKRRLLLEVANLIECYIKFATSNQDILYKDPNGFHCVYCGNTGTYEDITDWISDKAGPTAQCPNCGIDTLVPIGFTPPSSRVLLSWHQSGFRNTSLPELIEHDCDMCEVWLRILVDIQNLSN
jgi:DNA-directed RNA polymerase subunit RPC12/RpoP